MYNIGHICEYMLLACICVDGRLWQNDAAVSESVSGKPTEPVTDSVSAYGLGYNNGYYRGL